jgi:hypothetical protein
MFLDLPILLLSICAQVVSPGTAPSTQPANQPANLARLEAENASMPRREVASISQVLRIERQGDQLIARALLSDLPRENTRLIISDAPGFITMFLGTARVAGDPDPTDLAFIQRNFSGSGVTSSESITNIAMTAGHVTIARDAENAQGAVLSVQLMIDPPPPPGAADPDEPPVRLYISRNGERDDANNFSFKRVASSFRELCLQFPGDVNVYVRPILRDLKQEGTIFAPDPKIVWQVLGQDFKPDAPLIEKVNAQIAKLDADDFQERNAAQSQIRQLGQPAMIVLAHVDRSKMSAQTKSEIDSILESDVKLSDAEQKAMRDDPTFLLDTLSSDDAYLRRLAWERLKLLTHTTATFDPDSDASARAASITKVAESIRKR